MQRLVHPLVADYIYDLPEDLIARYPVEPFDSCRLLQISKSSGKMRDGFFYDLPEFLEAGDLLVANNTRVEARRVFLRRQGGQSRGARIETIFLDRAETQPDSAVKQCWRILAKKRQRLKDREVLVSEVDESIYFILHKLKDGRTFLEESTEMNIEVFEKIGQMPIPPYLHREEEAIDRSAYQNPHAEQLSEKSGSVAAPTASLHFTKKVLDSLREKQIQLEYLNLQIGYGTFAPLREENIIQKQLHAEKYELPENLAEILAGRQYNRLYAIGTTTLRVLETVHRHTSGRYDSLLAGKTNIFLHPPDVIESVDGMITNFHLPGSSLLMLVSCLLGRDKLLNTYGHAIDNRYRFFSYGDAMLIQP